MKPERIKWLWRGYIPLGKLTILEGDPGTGKSSITIDFAARVSTNSAMPDGSVSDIGNPSGVVLIGHEDDLGDTVVPRLIAAGADLTRIISRHEIVEKRGDRRIPRLTDLDALEADVLDVGAKLVVIDPVMAYIPGKTNTGIDAEVRRLLTPLAEMAARLGVAIVLVRHLNKNVNSFHLYRGGASIAFTATVRSSLLVAQNPEIEGAGVLLVNKTNVASGGRAFGYHLEPIEDVARIEWDGPVRFTPSQLLAPALVAGQRQLDQAKTFLLDELANGPVDSTEIQEKAQSEGISLTTLIRAKGELPVRSQKKHAMNAGWQWELVDEEGE